MDATCTRGVILTPGRLRAKSLARIFWQGEGDGARAEELGSARDRTPVKETTEAAAEARRPGESEWERVRVAAQAFPGRRGKWPGSFAGPQPGEVFLDPPPGLCYGGLFRSRNPESACPSQARAVLG